MGTTITEAQAEAYLRADLEWAAAAIERTLKVPLAGQASLQWSSAGQMPIGEPTLLADLLPSVGEAAAPPERQH